MRLGQAAPIRLREKEPPICIVGSEKRISEEEPGNEKWPQKGLCVV
jgi:hypothetical protein